MLIIAEVILLSICFKKKKDDTSCIYIEFAIMRLKKRYLSISSGVNLLVDGIVIYYIS